jgi:glutaconate CoA-transferase subunit B
MTLTGLRPGVTVEQVRDEVSWALKVSPDLKDADAPSSEQLRIIREELDPKGIYSK